MRRRLFIIFTILSIIVSSSSIVFAIEAPQHFRASQNGPIAADKINFAWDNDLFGSGGIKGYKIYEDGKEILDVGKKLTAVLTNVSIGTHKFTVKAYNQNGIVSKNSNQVIIKVLEAPRIVRSSNVDRKIKIEWTRPTGIKIKHFVVLRNGTFYKTVDGIHSSFEDNKIAMNVSYDYSVVLVDNDGNYSLQSNQVTEKVIKYQKNRGQIEASVDPLNDKRIKVTWNGNDNQLFSVYRNTDNGSWRCVYETKGSSFYDYDIELGNTYRYQVKAFDSNKNTIYETYEKKVSLKKSLSNQLTGVISKIGVKIPKIQLTGSITGLSNSFNLISGNYIQTKIKPEFMNEKNILDGIQGKLINIKSIKSSFTQRVENYAKGKTIKLENTQSKILTRINFSKDNLGKKIGQFSNKHFDELGNLQLKVSSLRSTGDSIMEMIGGLKTSLLSKI